MSVSIRKVEEPVYDGSTGNQIDTHVRYELGGEIDGTFIPFANVRQSFVGHLQDLDRRKKEGQQAGATEQAASEPSGGTGAPQSAQVPTEPQTTTGETAEGQ